MSGWPELSVERDHETLAVLHLAAQMVGKIRVAHAPWVNHGWHVALQPNARGLASLPTAASGGRPLTLTLAPCRPRPWAHPGRPRGPPPHPPGPRAPPTRGGRRPHLHADAGPLPPCDRA